MPGTITIQTQIGCDADEVIMTLSGAAEPNGGDHYATVDFTGRRQNIPLVGLLNVEMETSPGVWVHIDVQSFLFTSAGEQYTLRARGHELVMNWPNIQFPYTVVAVYAPAWAAIDGIINGTPVDAPCCDYSSEAADILSNNILLLTSGNPGTVTSPQCTPIWTYLSTWPWEEGLLVHTGYGITAQVGSGSYRSSWTADVPSGSFSNTTNGTNQGPLAPQAVTWVTNIPYDWLNKEFTVVVPVSMSEGIAWKVFRNGGAYTDVTLTHAAASTITVTKVSGETGLRISVSSQTAAVTGGTGDGSIPSWSTVPASGDYIADRTGSVDGAEFDVALPCTGAVLRVKPSLYLIGGGDGSGNRFYPGTKMLVNAVIIKGTP